MIRSHLANALLGLFGLCVILYAGACWATLIRDEGLAFFRSAYETTVCLILTSVGLWCLLGALHNLRRLSLPAPSPPAPSITHTLAKWDLLLLFGAGGTSLISYLLGLTKVWIVLYYLFLFAFASIPIILLVAIVQRRTAKAGK